MTAPPPPQSAPPATAPVADGRVRPCVLVVDDNLDGAETMAALIDMMGGASRVAHDGGEALRLVPEIEPQLVLLDIGLPGMDGYEVARRLRQLPQTRKALFIALTGYGQKEDRAQAAAAGFQHHFIKPADPRAIHSVISRFGAGPEKGSEQFISQG
jgi:CheY-like chemotaxis protein